MMNDNSNPVDSELIRSRWSIAEIDRALAAQEILLDRIIDRAHEFAEMWDRLHLTLAEIAQAKPDLALHLAEIESSPNSITSQDLWRAHDELIRVLTLNRGKLDHYEKFVRIVQDDVRLLAKLGWTVPLWGDLLFARDIMRSMTGQEPSRGELINRTFEDYYTRNGGIEFEKLKQDLLSCSGLKQWQDTLIECFECYAMAKYQVIVPTLLSVIEGAVTTATGKSKKKPTPAIASRRKAAVNSVDLLIWLSIEQYIGDLFRDHSFDSPEPFALNRNRTMHGRSSRKITRLDCIKLFHCLHTISNEVRSSETEPIVVAE